MDAAIDEVRLLADPTRGSIVRLIIEADAGRATVTQLAVELGLRQPTLSHHVKLLHEAGLLERAPEGRRVWYSVPPERLDAVSELVVSPPQTSPVALDRVVDDLTQRFAGTFGRETVERYVRETDDLFAAQGVDRRRASRTASFAADRLTALARVEVSDAHRPEVLFVCVQNAGRSQLAAGILRQLAGDRVVVRTAGSEPAEVVRGAVVTALDEIGVSLGGEYPKPLTDEVVRAADVVVTMGCGDACPVYPGKVYLDWPIPDPAGLPLAGVRPIRDDIDARVRELLATLV
ncbi:metalloregulator ArsR/SmtB family transcription factor [Microbacterium sp. 2FI]|uniref:metalloregulator ArsR/SmtB family transcription factor n=1 Tax=Microbacterium sp. 2FI TaxID=2502193 RepID=UPI0010FA12D0|nr:metalloregulator ArsR/SmtB family transcription factor [Microbacterium sp. 2FI]